MSKGYITDHADRTWCIKVESPAWWEAAWKEAKAKGISPKVPIGNAYPRIPTVFKRKYK